MCADTRNSKPKMWNTWFRRSMYCSAVTSTSSSVVFDDALIESEDVLEGVEPGLCFATLTGEGEFVDKDLFTGLLELVLSEAVSCMALMVARKLSRLAY